MIKAKILKFIYWVVAIFPFGLSLFVFPKLPSKVPMHFNAHGVVDRYGSKWEYLFLGLFLSILILIYFFVELYFKKKNKDFPSKNEILIASIVAGIAFSCIMIWLTVKCLENGSDNFKFRIDEIMNYFLALSFIVFGWTFKSVKMNSVYGIRTTWTLKDESVWDKTHQIGYKVFVIGGIIGLIVSIFLPQLIALIILMAFLFISIIFFVIYSKQLYMKNKGKR